MTSTPSTAAPSTGAPPDQDAEALAQRRRNLKLGLAIGALCVAQVVLFMIIFKRNGLPKDPKIWREMQAREALRNPSGPGPAPTTPTKDSHE